MPKFSVTLHRDAWINYTAVVEAANPKAAAERVLQAWESGDAAVVFDEVGESRFESAVVDPGEPVEPAE